MDHNHLNLSQSILKLAEIFTFKEDWDILKRIIKKRLSLSLDKLKGAIISSSKAGNANYSIFIEESKWFGLAIYQVCLKRSDFREVLTVKEVHRRHHRNPSLVLQAVH
jgi:hypothetical protein